MPLLFEVPKLLHKLQSAYVFEQVFDFLVMGRFLLCILLLLLFKLPFVVLSEGSLFFLEQSQLVLELLLLLLVKLLCLCIEFV